MDRYGLVNVVNAGAGKQRDVKERPGHMAVEKI